MVLPFSVSPKYLTCQHGKVDDKNWKGVPLIVRKFIPKQKSWLCPSLGVRHLLVNADYTWRNVSLAAGVKWDPLKLSLKKHNFAAKSVKTRAKTTVCEIDLAQCKFLCHFQLQWLVLRVGWLLLYGVPHWVGVSVPVPVFVTVWVLVNTDVNVWSACRPVYLWIN